MQKEYAYWMDGVEKGIKGINNGEIE
jgi:hypothetical protein